MCPESECSEVVTLVLVQITADLQHDSFVARAAHEKSFKYLADKGIPMDVVLQFCDNCAAQYKSQHPFAELARSPLNIIRVFFGEKHGKSQCDGLFRRLKTWMTFRIKSRHTFVTDAHDFYRYCKSDYKTPEMTEGKCQHYRVVFQFLTPSDIRRHQDCTLDEAVTGTRKIYSVRNTKEPLKIKIRNVPCLCRACIEDCGDECQNAAYSDPWTEVNLIPVKGKSKLKYLKRKDPRLVSNRKGNENISKEELVEQMAVQDNEITDSDDEIIPLIAVDDDADEQEETIDLTTKNPKPGCKDNIFIDLTAEPAADEPEVYKDITIENVEEDDVIIRADENVNTMQGQSESVLVIAYQEESEIIPERLYWESILAALERCKTISELETLAFDLKKNLPPLRNRVKNIHFNPDCDYIDAVATASLPPDAPQDVHAIFTTADGNCFSHSVSKGYSGSEMMHLEI